MKKPLMLLLVGLAVIGLWQVQDTRFSAPGGAALAQSLGNLPGHFGVLGIDPSQTEIPLDEILSGGPPPQGIPALGYGGDWQDAAPPTQSANFVSAKEASDWLEDVEPVVAFSANGETRAYPLQILTWHEIVNDRVGGVPVAVTFCPLCNSALAFDRRIPLSEEAELEVLALNGSVAASLMDLDEAFLTTYAAQQGGETNVQKGLEVTFGVSGMLYNSNMLMFDTETSTLWSQLLGEGSVGTLAGTDLLRLAAQIVSFADFKRAFPDAPVLSRDTGFNRAYGRNPYVGYDRADTPAFLFRGESDGRLPPKARVITLELQQQSVAYPFEVLSAERVVNDQIADTPLVLFWEAGTASALDQASIGSSNDVGAVGVFERSLDGRSLTFSWNGEAMIDQETGSSWNLLGQATAGELAGKQLKPVVHDNTLWFAWAAFKPETRIFTGN